MSRSHLLATVQALQSSQRGSGSAVPASRVPPRSRRRRWIRRSLMHPGSTRGHGGSSDGPSPRPAGRAEAMPAPLDGARDNRRSAPPLASTILRRRETIQKPSDSNVQRYAVDATVRRVTAMCFVPTAERFGSRSMLTLPFALSFEPGDQAASRSLPPFFRSAAAQSLCSSAHLVEDHARSLRNIDHP